jgi:hypothetical protein
VPDKRQIRRNMKQLQRVQTWQLLVLLVLLAFVAATFLRLNNIGMVQRRDAVLSADKAADTAGMTDRLYDLQRYAASHMNANTGPFYLDQQYKRDVEKLVTEASVVTNPYGNINAEVDTLCRSRFSSYSQAWVQCFAEELGKYPAAPDPAGQVTLPSADLYRYDFISPRWSPDFAGWSVLVCLVIVVMILARLLSLVILRLMLKKHYRGI